MYKTTMFSSLAALSLWLIGSTFLLAAENSLSLRDAIEATLAENPQFQSFDFRERALKGEKQTANLNPPVRFGAEIENVIGTGDLNWFQSNEFTLSLSQVIELGDKRSARTAVVSRRQDLLTAEKRVLELELIGEVTRRYIGLASAQQKLATLTRSTALAREIVNTISTRVEAGRAPAAELSRATAELELSLVDEQSARHEIDVTRVRLSSLWNELNPAFSTVSANLLNIGESTDITALLAILERNPAILIYADKSRLREAQLREAKNLRYGDIQVGIGIRHIAALNDSAFTMQATMPLFSQKRASGVITSARANLALVEADRTNALLRLSTQLIALGYQRSQARDEFLAIQENVLTQLQNAFDETRAAYEAGRYSFLELSSAQWALINAELRLINAATRVHLLTAEIEQLSGESITEFTNGVGQ
jgi:cobalt-zinc-cadmium efflux system outer membrane protein